MQGIEPLIVNRDVCSLTSVPIAISCQVT